MLGAVRGVAQTVSYEVRIALLVLCVVFLAYSYSLIACVEIQKYLFFVFIILPVFLCWLSTILAETNRTPFDFAEGESELVSGFNIEYGRGGFALLFLAEYGRIIFISYLSVFLFFGGVHYNFLLMNFLGLILCSWFV
jgi:NADH-ubiquinone oxidoreductase chain 1